MEETGLDIVVSEIFNVYSGTDDPRTNAVLILYFGRVAGGIATAGDDAAEVGFFGIGEIPANIAFLAHRQAIADLQKTYPDLLR
jgi:ADP-ribose pyrophosphatase YjhB (NUDIX family)